LIGMALTETPQQYTDRLLSYTGDADGLGILSTTASRLRALVSGRSREELFRKPAPDRWSAGEILTHLADAEIAGAWHYGVHAERGRESVTHLMRLYAGHDLNHLRQLEQLLPVQAPAR
jgi:hypothetical protein